MAQPATGVSLWRFLAWVWVVMRHTKALITAFVGCFLFSLPAWLKPLLRPELQQNLDEWTAFAGEPQTYWYFAIGFFLIGILCASFLAWNEEKDELAEKLHELSDIKRELAEIKRESAYLQASVPKISLSIGKNIEVEVVWENK